MNLKENFYSVKRGIIKKALPLALAASIALGTPMGEIKAKAYNLEEPTISYDDFKDYDYTIIFLGGRMMEFTKETGHPYKKSKKVMIPVESLCNSIYGIYNYDSKTSTATIKRHGVTYTFKKGAKKIVVNDHGKKTTIKTKVANTIKSGKLYAQLSSVADAFKLTLKSDKKTGIINLNYKYDYENIDLKNNENNLVDLKKVKTSQYDKVMLDMTEIQPDYINVLKNTNQYKAFIETDHKDGKKTLYIFSYQMLENSDYIFGKYNEFINEFKSGKEPSVTLENVQSFKTKENESIDEDLFYWDAYRVLSLDVWTHCESENEKEGTVTYGISYPKKISITYEQYQEALKKAKELIETEKEFLLEEDGNYDDLFRDIILNLDPWYMEYGEGKTSYDGLVKGEGDCVSHQAALELVFDELGIPIVGVDGYIDGKAHQYGYAYNKGKWYVIDATNSICSEISKEEFRGLKDDGDVSLNNTRSLVMKLYNFDNK